MKRSEREKERGEGRGGTERGNGHLNIIISRKKKSLSSLDTVFKVILATHYYHNESSLTVGRRKKRKDEPERLLATRGEWHSLDHAPNHTHSCTKGYSG